MAKVISRVLMCLVLILPMAMLNNVYGAENSMQVTLGERATLSDSSYCDPNRGCIDPFGTFLQVYGHIQNIDWVRAQNMQNVGTVGQSLRLEAIKLALHKDYYGLIQGGIQYQAHVQNIGWQPPVSNGQVAGTTGRGLRMEAIIISLTGAAAVNYNLRYQAHVQNIGWMDWVPSGSIAGTTGRSLRLEALKIQMTPKGIYYNNDIYKEEH